MTYDEFTIAGIAFAIGSIFGIVLNAVLTKIADVHIRYVLRERFGITESEKPKADSGYDWDKTLDDVADCLASKLQNPPHIVVTHRGKRR
jgi:hypothetical protein